MHSYLLFLQKLDNSSPGYTSTYIRLVKSTVFLDSQLINDTIEFSSSNLNFASLNSSRFNDLISLRRSIILINYR